MPIKLIAVDMDGTFLSSQKEYNRQRFSRIYQEMQRQGIKFVVASGNQYYQLKSFFPEIEGEIAFVAENGALVVNKGETLFVGGIKEEVIDLAFEVIQRTPQAQTIICGEKSAYILRNESEEFFDFAKNYYHRLKWIDDPSQIDDKIIKFALNFSATDASEALALLETSLDGSLIPVSSGYGAIDLITPGTHKAFGLAVLQNTWGIEAHEIAAFGDNGNDYEMISHAGFGFAMKNAAPKILQAADYISQFDNDGEGVLVELERLLKMAPEK